MCLVFGFWFSMDVGYAKELEDRFTNVEEGAEGYITFQKNNRYYLPPNILYVISTIRSW